MKLKRIETGLYEYRGYQVYRWWHDETSYRYPWSVALDGEWLDDFRTLTKAKAYIDRGN